MSDSLKITLGLIKTPASGTQSNPLGDDYEDDISIDEDSGAMSIVVSAATAIPLAHLGACTSLAVKNFDATKYVKVIWTDSLASANVQKLPPGRSILIPDLNPAETCQLNPEAGGSPLCKVYFGGTS